MSRMKSLLVILTLAAVAILGYHPASGYAQFNSSGQLNLIHGLPGDDLDNENLDLDFPSALPVDICVGLPGTGTLNCFYSNVTLGEIKGPLQMTVGTYQVEFREADLVSPGSGSLIASATVPIQGRDNRAAILHVTTTRTPKVTAYRNDTSLLPLTGAKVVFRHNSQIGPVDMSLVSPFALPGATGANLSNPQQSSVSNLMTGPYMLHVRPAAKSTDLLPPENVFLSPHSGTAYYLIGSTERQTLAVIRQQYRP
jgi:hypothetical protein